MGFDPVGSPVAALPLRACVTVQALKGAPADRTRCADPEVHRRLAARHAATNRHQHSPPQVHRKRHGHACRPPDPADSLNQKTAASGIPSDSVSSETALITTFVSPSRRIDIGRILITSLSVWAKAVGRCVAERQAAKARVAGTNEATRKVMFAPLAA